LIGPGETGEPKPPVAQSHKFRSRTDYAHLVDDVSDETFADEVVASPVPVIVDFWAPWCKPCRAIEPHLVGIAEGAGHRVRLVRMNVDENLAVPARYGVLSLPTVMLFAGGDTRVTIYGAHTLRHYEQAFAPYFD
jgi:thioredoxin 1